MGRGVGRGGGRHRWKGWVGAEAGTGGKGGGVRGSRQVGVQKRAVSGRACMPACVV